MANPYYLPTGYQVYNPYQQYTQQTVQASGLVSVRSEDEARNYPVAPGNSVTFKSETAPYIYSKTMGSSQLDRPVFERFRLVKEDAPQAAETTEATQTVNLSGYATKAEIEALRAEIDALKDTKRKAKRGDNDE